MEFNTLSALRVRALAVKNYLQVSINKAVCIRKEDDEQENLVRPSMDESRPLPKLSAPVSDKQLMLPLLLQADPNSNAAKLLLPGLNVPDLSEPSNVLKPVHIAALLSEVPSRFRFGQWQLLYSSARDGISLRTLYRNMARAGAILTVIRDFQGYVFGCFTPEAWKVANRFYGNGETFVFQLEPRRLAWHWWQRAGCSERNDFFMLGGDNGIAVGGAGKPAIWLGSDLLQGSSAFSHTFGSPTLAASPEFEVGLVEVWGLG